MCPMFPMHNCPPYFVLLKFLVALWVIIVIPALIIARLDKIIKLLERK